ncbi:Regulator of nonsense transcripts 1 [Symbiodinium microadriaticum]|uniref:Regulator of nonsense transcripts 1 n=1 Tax=Symbiodinium microadriaticum TaxID=2951 RepID=A0A1Q9DDZ3_SYMMI|nr:Regulator of nonsense transcripts 1 [Symbiodinium microadriaticum]
MSADSYDVTGNRDFQEHSVCAFLLSGLGNMLLNWVLHQRARRPIGFLSDPRRLNVAVSRAVAGLVIVGDLQHLARYRLDNDDADADDDDDGELDVTLMLAMLSTMVLTMAVAVMITTMFTSMIAMVMTATMIVTMMTMLTTMLMISAVISLSMDDDNDDDGDEHDNDDDSVQNTWSSHTRNRSRVLCWNTERGWLVRCGVEGDCAYGPGFAKRYTMDADVDSWLLPLSAVPPEQASAAWSTLTAECPADLEAAAKIAREDAAKAAEDKDQTKLAAEVADEEKRKAEQAEQDRIRAEKNLLSAVKTADAQVGWLAAMSGVVE